MLSSAGDWQPREPWVLAGLAAKMRPLNLFHSTSLNASPTRVTVLKRGLTEKKVTHGPS